jgi:hypothetical protein
MPVPPEPLTPTHHACTTGASADPTTTRIKALAKPAAKLLTLGLRDGRYRKPEPAECGGMMKIS